MKTRTREIAKVGVFGSIENPTAVRESDLMEIAETFKEIKTAPIKLGAHWSEDRPRLGQVVAVEYDKKNKRLMATIEEQDALAKAVDEDGYYPDVSIGAKQRANDGKMYLHHLAYLGDEPPAIKDLEQQIAKDMEEAEKTDIAASDAEKDFFVFPHPGAKMLVLSDSSTTHEPLLDENKKDPKETSGKSMSEELPSESNKEGQMTEKEIKAMQEEYARLKADNEAKDKLLSDSVHAQHLKEKEELRKAAEGKVTQPEMEKLMALADSFEEAKTIELSDSDGNKKTERPLSVLAGIFAGVNAKVEAGEINLSDGEPDHTDSLKYNAF